MGRFRIMVVDDDPDVRFVVTSLLGLEFETVGAQNGLDALEKIDRYEPDLLLMDISMPVMNGIACCQAIQRNPLFENIPVMFVAAASDPATKKAALAVGGKAYIEKPFDTADVIRQIKATFAGAGITPSAKAFSLEQIAQIDTSPLEASSSSIQSIGPAQLQGMSSEVTVQLHDFSGLESKDGKGKRRVFGKGAHHKEAPAPTPAEPSPEKKPADDDSVALPPPPAPDYKAVAARYEQLRSRQVEKLPPAAPPPPSTAPLVAKVTPPPPTPVAPPAPAPQHAPPAAPPPPAEKELSPAEILAQRRLGKIPGKAASAPVLKPRLLSIIDYPEQLDTCNEATRGFMEFLPLEDPVEALVLIARFQPDIVMVGVHEQKYSGLQVAQMIGTNPRLAHIEIIFQQSTWAEPSHLNAARRLSKNPILRPPVNAASLQGVLKEIVARPGFKVREKNLTYGVYVKEVIKTAEAERARENKLREKESLRVQHRSLARFMAEELKDYPEATGMEELLGVGRKVHHVRTDN